MRGLSQAVETCFANLPDGPVGVAVSGGSDSLALLVLAHGSGRKIFAATVDHGLREESADEAAGVARYCAELGIEHQTLTWDSAPQGNLQAAAREARLELLCAWAKRLGLAAVALGHTRDDQAETVLMRLARGSGVDGLSGMAASRKVDGALMIRPLLAVQRADLKVFLESRNMAWVNDPSNEDERFDRVKARRALEHLSALGIDADGLVATAERMARARAGLEQATYWLAKDAVSLDNGGALRFELVELLKAREELALRLLAGSLCWISGQVYRPRAASLEKLYNSILTSGLKTERLTLHGVDCEIASSKLILTREAVRVQPAVPLGDVWDHRWQVNGDAGDGTLTVGALGDAGLAQCKEWRETGQSKRVLLATPGVWKGDTLLAAPCAGLENGYKAELIGGLAGYYAAILAG